MHQRPRFCHQWVAEVPVTDRGLSVQAPAPGDLGEVPAHSVEAQRWDPVLMSCI